MGGQESKQTPLGHMLKNCKEGFSGDFGVKPTPQKLCTFYELDWPSFDVGRSSEGSLDKAVIARVYQVIVGNPSHSDQFP